MIEQNDQLPFAHLQLMQLFCPCVYRRYINLWFASKRNIYNVLLFEFQNNFTP